MSKLGCSNISYRNLIIFCIIPMFFSITEKNSLDIIFYVDFKQDWKNRMLLLEKCWIFLHSIDSTKHAMKLNQIILGVALFHVYVISCYHLFMNFLIQWPIWIIVSWSKISTELWRCGHWMPYCRKVCKSLVFLVIPRPQFFQKFENPDRWKYDLFHYFSYIEKGK